MNLSTINSFKSGSKGLMLGTAVLLLSSSGGKPSFPWENENVSFPMLNMEIRHQLEENERQENLTKEAGASLALETTSSSLWKSYESSNRESRSRLSELNLLFQSLPAAHLLSEKSRRIAENKEALFQVLENSPYLLAVILEDELGWVEELEMTLLYIAALLASTGTLNQMEPADRKILLDFALEEVESLERKSREFLFRAREAKEKLEFKKAAFSYYVNRDKALVRSLLTYLKI